MENKTFDQLWEDFRIENPNTVGAFQDQYESFKWLYDRLKGTKDNLAEEKDYLDDDPEIKGWTIGPFGTPERL